MVTRKNLVIFLRNSKRKLVVFKTRGIFTRRPKYIAHQLFEIKMFKWLIISRQTLILLVTNARKKMTRVRLET